LPEILDNIIVSVATIFLLSGTGTKLDKYLSPYAIPLIIIGVLVLVLGKYIIRDLEASFIKRLLKNSVGLLLLLQGIQYWVNQNLVNYWFIYIFVGIILFQYHKEMSNVIG